MTSVSPLYGATSITSAGEGFRKIPMLRVRSVNSTWASTRPPAKLRLSVTDGPSTVVTSMTVRIGSFDASPVSGSMSGQHAITHACWPEHCEPPTVAHAGSPSAAASHPIRYEHAHSSAASTPTRNSISRPRPPLAPPVDRVGTPALSPCTSSPKTPATPSDSGRAGSHHGAGSSSTPLYGSPSFSHTPRSEERRVGKEGRARWAGWEENEENVGRG